MGGLASLNGRVSFFNISRFDVKTCKKQGRKYLLSQECAENQHSTSNMKDKIFF